MKKQVKERQTRRAFLKGGLMALGGVAVVVSGAGVYQAVQEDVFSPFEGPAYQPWSTWKSDVLTGSMALVQSAILAANPHNTQPWRFRVTDHKIELFADLQRHLGSFDPYRREMWIGFGCAIENMLLTAEAQGLNAGLEVIDGGLTINPMTDGIVPVATLTLSPGKRASGALYEAIPNRHTHRGPYLPERKVSSETQQQIKAIASTLDTRLSLFAAGPDRREFDRLMEDATHAIVEDSEMVMDSHHWFRETSAALQRHRDGITIDAAGLSPVMTTLAKLFPAPDPHTGHRMWENATRDVHLATAPLTGIISVKDRYDKAENIKAGRCWQRLHLHATTLGMAMQPMNQPVEWNDRQQQLGAPLMAQKRLAELTGESDWLATFVFRAGFAANPAPLSPRRPLDKVVV